MVQPAFGAEYMHGLISGWSPNQKKSDRGRSRHKEHVPNHDVIIRLCFLNADSGEAHIHLHVWQLYNFIVQTLGQDSRQAGMPEPMHDKGW